MHKQTIKTTIELDAELVRLAKIQAINQGISLKKIVNNGLAKVLNKKKVTKKKPLKIGSHNLGGIKTKLSRSQLYEDF